MRRLLSGAGVCSLYLGGFKLSEFNIDSKDLPAELVESIFAGRRITRPSPQSRAAQMTVIILFCVLGCTRSGLILRDIVDHVLLITEPFGSSS